MCDRTLTKCLLTFAAVVNLPLSSSLAQELPKSDNDSFDIEPPLLVQPREPERAPDESQEDAPTTLDPAKLAQRLEGTKKSAASAARLAKSGVLSKAEAEQRGLHVIRLESDLAQAQLTAAQEQMTSLKARLVAGQTTQVEVAAASAALTAATAAAQAAVAQYHKAQLDAAELNLGRQRKLLALGSAHKSDVARAEEKLTKLQRDDQTPR
jgi:hypothetical protein